jgi:hypothetical protein
MLWKYSHKKLQTFWILYLNLGKVYLSCTFAHFLYVSIAFYQERFVSFFYCQKRVYLQNKLLCYFIIFILTRCLLTNVFGEYLICTFDRSKPCSNKNEDFYQFYHIWYFPYRCSKEAGLYMNHFYYITLRIVQFEVLLLSLLI